MRAVAAAALLLAAGCAGPRRDVRKADAYLTEGRSTAAVRLYEKALQARPGMPAALVGLARAQLAVGAPEKAVVPAQVALEVGEDAARLPLAEALVETGRGREALAVLGGGPPSRDAGLWHALHAEALLASGDRPGARAAAEAAVAAGAAGRGHVLLAWIALRDGSADAPDLARRAALDAAGDPAIQGDAAAVLRLAGDAAGARDAASLAQTLLPAGPAAWAGAASRVAAGGDVEGAARRAARLRAVYPDEGLYARDLGRAWLAAGESARAALELEAALKLPPFFAGESAAGVTRVDRRSDGWSTAERDAERAAVLADVVRAREASGDLRAVAQAVQDAAAASTDAGAWVAVAVAWERAGNLDLAVAAGRRAVELDPRRGEGHLALARLYGRTRDTNRALGHARAAAELLPNSPDAALVLGNLYLARGEADEAVKVLGVAVAAHPQDARLRAALERARAQVR